MASQDSMNELVEQFDRRVIDRRELMRRAGALGLSATAVGAALTRVDGAMAEEPMTDELSNVEEGTMMDNLEAGDSMLARFSDDLAGAVERAGAAVVTINARRRMPATGIVWDVDGTVVTANHVVERDEEITVGLPDGREVAATLIGRDAGTDLAVLKIDAPDLTAAPRKASLARTGNFVLAVGRPGPAGPMASHGVVSVVGGSWQTPQGSFDGYIRADVAMLPGFSGGPLVDARGNVLGLNSSGFGRGGGLTVPVDVIERVVETLRTHGRIRRGFLGIGAQAVRLPAALVKAQELAREQGLLIVSVEADSPAERDGLMIGDVIVALAGKPVAEVEELQGRLSSDWVGRLLPMRLIRGGAPHEVSVTVGERT